MKVCLTLIFCLSMTGSSYSQIADVIEKSNAVYLNFNPNERNYFIDGTEDVDTRFSRRFSFGSPSVSYRKEYTSGFIKELELSDLALFRRETISFEVDTSSFVQVTSGFQTTRSSGGLRYEISKKIHESRSSKVSFYLGCAGYAHYTAIDLEPMVSTSFGAFVSDVSFSSQLVPRVSIDLSESVELDFNFLVDWIRQSSVWTTDDNPRIPLRLRRQFSSETSCFSSLPQLRIGLKMDLWKES